MDVAPILDQNLTFSARSCQWSRMRMETAPSHSGSGRYGSFMPQTPSPGSRRTEMRGAARRDEQRRGRRRLALWIGASVVALAVIITAGVLISRPEECPSQS